MTNDLSAINAHIAKLDKEIAPLKKALGKAQALRESLIKQKTPLIKNLVFEWKDKQFPIARIRYEQTYYFNNDPYTGGCNEQGPKRISLYEHDRSRAEVVVDDQYSKWNNDQAQHQAIKEAFRKQFDVKFEDAVALIDNRGNNIVPY